MVFIQIRIFLSKSVKNNNYVYIYNMCVWAQQILVKLGTRSNRILYKTDFNVLTVRSIC